ncbi:MAG: hypothetical protein ACYDHG_10470 [Desulfomonilaceae bacterium]
MAINHSAVTTIVTLLIILFIEFGLFIIPAVSQQNATRDRTQCIEKCRERNGGGYFWGEGSGNQQIYYQCLTGCEKKFWIEWEKEMDKVKKD